MSNTECQMKIQNVKAILCAVQLKLHKYGIFIWKMNKQNMEKRNGDLIENRIMGISSSILLSGPLFKVIWTKSNVHFSFAVIYFVYASFWQETQTKIPLSNEKKCLIIPNI